MPAPDHRQPGRKARWTVQPPTVVETVEPDAEAEARGLALLGQLIARRWAQEQREEGSEQEQHTGPA